MTFDVKINLITVTRAPVSHSLEILVFMHLSRHYLEFQSRLSFFFLLKKCHKAKIQQNCLTVFDLITHTSLYRELTLLSFSSSLISSVVSWLMPFWLMFIRKHGGLNKNHLLKAELLAGFSLASFRSFLRFLHTEATNSSYSRETHSAFIR